DCGGHHGFRPGVPAPPAGPSTDDSVTSDEGVKTTIRCVVLSADLLPRDDGTADAHCRRRRASQPEDQHLRADIEKPAGRGLQMPGNRQSPSKGATIVIGKGRWPIR